PEIGKLALGESGARGATENGARAVVNIYLELLGVEAANLALKAGATGGIFLAGGIVQKLHTLIAGSGFCEGFADKGRFAGWMREIPVFAVTTDDLGLRGCVEYLAVSFK